MVTDALTQGTPAPQTAVVTPQVQKPVQPTPQPITPPEVKQVTPPKPEPPKRIETPKVVEKKPKVNDDELHPVTKASNDKVSTFSLNSSKTKHVLDDASLKKVTHKVPKNNSKTAPKDDSDERAAEAAYEAKVAKSRAAARAFSSALTSISKNTSGATPVKIDGPGSSAFSAVNYDNILASRYYNAWTAPGDVSDSAPPVLVTITVSRDGNVISARIIKHSGNSSLDNSIQNALNAVSWIEAFPEGSSDQQRTFKISFNLDVKRQIG